MSTTSTVIETIKDLVADTTLLVRQEISLARAEAEEKFEQVQTGVAAVAAGMLLAFVALIVLVQALVVALSNIMPPSIASLLVGVVLAVIAFVAVKNGSDQLKVKNLKPRRTMRSVRESAETIREAR